MPDNPKSESIPESLMRSAANEYTTDALIQISESLFDQATGSLLKGASEVPVISLLVASGKGILDLRERIYVNKLIHFLIETNRASKKDRQKYRAKLDSDPKEVKKAGMTILDILDKVTDVQKAAMMGKVFHASMHEDVSFEVVVTLCEMIQKAYLNDLIDLSKGKNANEVNLENVGIKKPMRSEDVNIALKALEARMLKQMPVIREGPINDERSPEVLESGLTEYGSLLQRILRDY